MTDTSPLSLPHEENPFVELGKPFCVHCCERVPSGGHCELRTLRAQVEIARRAAAFWADRAHENWTEDDCRYFVTEATSVMRELAAALRTSNALDTERKGGG